jgi:hypothetical protein
MGLYPYIWIYSGLLNKGHITGKPDVSPNPLYYSIDIPANIPYTGLRYGWSGFEYYISATPSNLDVSLIKSGNIINGFKMSSVPYDIIGTGF